MSDPIKPEPACSGRTPEMLQDASRGLSKALAQTPGARLHAREAAHAIESAPFDWGRYYADHPRMEIYMRRGGVVYFDGMGGYPSEKEFAKKTLTMHAPYLVKRVNVGSSHSYVELEGVEGTFNTVMFTDRPFPAASIGKESP